MEETVSKDVQEIRRIMRRDALTRRDAIPLEERHSKSETIATSLQGYIQTLGCRSVHCYISFRSEVETRTCIEELLARGIRVTVPIVEQMGSSRALGHTEISSLSELSKGYFGLEEPTTRIAASLESLNAVIIPVVAFDRAGTRLGYGMGFYDRFLRNLPRRIPHIGLAFGIQESCDIPRESHDVPLDTVITELEILSITQ